MKNLVFALALIGFPCSMMIGCGGQTGTVLVEGDLEEGQESITESQMSDYEEQMKNGGGGSAPGQAPN